MNENLQRLRELTHKLTTYKEIPQFVYDKSVEVDLEKGHCTGWKVLVEEDMGVHKWFMTAGSEFPNHKHECMELLVVYKGHMSVIVDGERYKLGRGDSLKIEAGKEHALIYEEDTWALTITIPLEEGFPK